MNSILNKIKSVFANEGCTIDNPLDFILAGKAFITVINTKTKKRFTYKIYKKKTDEVFKNIYFVSVLTGSDSTRSYSYIGTIFESAFGLKFRLTKKTSLEHNDTRIIAFSWLLDQLKNKTLPNYVKLYHEGRCGKCGRSLTTPDSIKAGFGPDCLKRM